MVIRIATMVLRASAVLALILGLFFWFSSIADNLVPVHMLLGFLVVFSLWTIGIGQALSRNGNWGIAIAALVVGALLPVVGLGQGNWLTGSAHWVIQVLHLLVALLALGVGEMAAGRYRRQTRSVLSQSPTPVQ